MTAAAARGCPDRGSLQSRPHGCRERAPRGCVSWTIPASGSRTTRSRCSRRPSVSSRAPAIERAPPSSRPLSSASSSRCTLSVAAADAAAHALIPPGDLHESISHRYARAAAAWPGAADGAGPSHERQAQLLASIDDTAGALRTAAACCARTSRSRGRDDGRAREHARAGNTERDAEGRVTIAVHAMTVSSARTPATRAPDNELYDRGCDLVEAAMAIRRVADAPEAVRAVPAVLGCIEAALRELLWAAAALEETSARTVEQRLRQRGLDRETEGRAHAARLCEPPDGSRRRRARFGRGSLARRSRAGGRKAV